jgi:hypothetical protein
MITMQHSLVTLFGLRGDVDAFEKEIGYVLLPDGIRRYCGPRPYSHFEENPEGTDISYMHFPLNLKTLTKDNIGNERMHLAEGYKPCVLGEKTHIEAFERTNGDLPPRYFAGVKKHLIQDVIFDDFIREGIGLDCSRKFDSMYSPEETTGKNVGVFLFNRPLKNNEGNFLLDSNGNPITKTETLDGNGVRKLIADIENQGLYILAYMLHESYGITANQEWFDKHVKPALDKEYSEDLANGTYGYMKIPEDINNWITNHDWTHLNDGVLPLKTYTKMYESVIQEMPKVDAQRVMKEVARERTSRTHFED